MLATWNKKPRCHSAIRFPFGMGVGPAIRCQLTLGHPGHHDSRKAIKGWGFFRLTWGKQCREKPQTHRHSEADSEMLQVDLISPGKES
jgi:hypothetical protein